MVLYTCIKNINTNHYECYKGIRDYDSVHLEDFRIISIPPSNLSFEIFRNLMDLQLLKYTLRFKVIIEE
jgi:hypothetical protein